MAKNELKERLPLPKLAIFDMDGLLFDTERLFMRKLTQVMADYGYECTEEKYTQTLGLSDKNLADKLIELFGAGYPHDMISKKTRILCDEDVLKNGPPIKPGALRLLKFFSAYRVPCCVASSSPLKSVKMTVARAGFGKYFMYYIGGDMVNYSKPNPEIFTIALAKAADFACFFKNPEPSDALILEDSENGLIAAKAAGIPAVCVPDMKRPSPDVLKSAVAEFETLEAVIKLFEH